MVPRDSALLIKQHILLYFWDKGCSEYNLYKYVCTWFRNTARLYTLRNENKKNEYIRHECYVQSRTHQHIRAAR